MVVKKIKKVSLKDKVEQQLNNLLDSAMNGKLDYEKAAIVQQILKSAIDFIKLKDNEDEGSFFKSYEKGEENEEENK